MLLVLPFEYRVVTELFRHLVLHRGRFSVIPGYNFAQYCTKYRAVSGANDEEWDACEINKALTRHNTLENKSKYSGPHNFFASVECADAFLDVYFLYCSFSSPSLICF